MPIRPFLRDDIPQVALLHQRIFATRRRSPAGKLNQNFSDHYHEYFDRVYFRSPLCDGDIRPLVSEKADGRIVGFLGVLPRRMLWRGRPLRVAVCSQFMVDPAAAGHGALLLLKHFAGPQDLSIADDADEDGRKAWQAVGGSLAVAYSTGWTRVLGPFRQVASKILSLPAVTRLPLRTGPVFRPLDFLAERLFPQTAERRALPEPAGELAADTLCACLPRFIGDKAIQPLYEPISVSWILDCLARQKEYGKLSSAVFCDPTGQISGWYLYYLKPGGVSTVAQFVARRGAAGPILDHLFVSARRAGSVAVRGMLLPGVAAEVTERRCAFSCGTPWVLVHSKNRDLLKNFLQGEAFFSRLEGEWPMRFPASPR